MFLVCKFFAAFRIGILNLKYWNFPKGLGILTISSIYIIQNNDNDKKGVPLRVGLSATIFCFFKKKNKRISASIPHAEYLQSAKVSKCQRAKEIAEKLCAWNKSAQTYVNYVKRSALCALIKTMYLCEHYVVYCTKFQSGKVPKFQSAREPTYQRAKVKSP